MEKLQDKNCKLLVAEPSQGLEPTLPVFSFGHSQSLVPAFLQTSILEGTL